MKSILYVGATLMLGASIYGMVDYRNNSQKKEFTGMYESKDEKIPVVLEENDLPLVKKEVAEASKKTERKKLTRKEEIAPVKNNAKEFITTVEPIEEVIEATINTEEMKKNISVEKIKSAKSKKKLNHKLFSRGSMEDRYVEKTLQVEEPKVEKKKAKEEL